MTRFASFLAGAILLLGGKVARAQDAPVEASLCDVAKDPKSFDGKTIRVRGTLNVTFEDFSLSANNCAAQTGTWLAFGGDVPGIVDSTANDNFRKPGVDFHLNGVPYAIEKDENFRKLYALIAARHGDKPTYRVTAALSGVFFAGAESKMTDGRTTFRGYGHLGCCSLLIITKVSEVTSVPPATLDVRGVVLGTGGKPLAGFTVFDDVLGGWPPVRQEIITDEHGRFHFANSGQLLRFENSKYRPVALAIEPGGDPVRVQLEDAKKTDWLVRECEIAAVDSQRVGFSVLFKLPSTMTSELVDNEDQHTYFVNRTGEESIKANFFIEGGPEAWKPADEFVESSWSEQRWIRDSAGKMVGVDAVGRRKKGGRWRTTIFFDRDSVSYSLGPEKGTRIFDGIVDSACLAQ